MSERTGRLIVLMLAAIFALIAGIYGTEWYRRHKAEVALVDAAVAERCRQIAEVLSEWERGLRWGDSKPSREEAERAVKRCIELGHLAE